MKKIEYVYREILYQAIEKNNMNLTQLDLSKKLHISLSTVNLALQSLKHMNSIRIKKMCFEVIDIKKILYHWASVRNLSKDIIYQTRVDLPVKEIEKLMPDTVVFTAYTAYKFKFKDVPADYSETYVYSDEDIEKRFAKNDKPPNLFVLKKDNTDSYGKIATTANIFVDIWNIPQWYGKEFLIALEDKIGRILE